MDFLTMLIDHHERSQPGGQRTRLGFYCILWISGLSLFCLLFSISRGHSKAHFLLLDSWLQQKKVHMFDVCWTRNSFEDKTFCAQDAWAMTTQGCSIISEPRTTFRRNHFHILNSYGLWRTSLVKKWIISLSVSLPPIESHDAFCVLFTQPYRCR